MSISFYNFLVHLKALSILILDPPVYISPLFGGDDRLGSEKGTYSVSRGKSVQKKPTPLISIWGALCSAATAYQHH